MSTEIIQEPVQGTVITHVEPEESGLHLQKVATAKRYPRSITNFVRQTTELATLSEATAQRCFYHLPRGNKAVEGPSIRFAEIVAHAFRNLSYGARVVAVDHEFVDVEGVCYDYENNVSVSFPVRKGILTSTGKRYSEDMIVMTARAACAIAMREAIFKIVPRAFWEDIYEQAKVVSIGKGKTMDQQREACLEFWKKAGIKQATVLEFLGKKGLDDVTTDDLIMLRGMATAMKEEGIAADELFRRESDARALKRATNPLDPVEV